MKQADQKTVRVDRRDFIKATTLAGMAGTFSGASAIAQNAPIPSRPRNVGKTRKVLFAGDLKWVLTALPDIRSVLLLPADARTRPEGMRLLSFLLKVP